MFRQGDVLITPLDKAPSLKNFRKAKRDPRRRIVLAEGEVTGHAHAIRSRNATLFVADSLAPANEFNPDQAFLEVEKPAQVEHEEHDTINLKPGWYEVRRQREYSPEAIRQVAD